MMPQEVNGLPWRAAVVCRSIRFGGGELRAAIPSRCVATCKSPTHPRFIGPGIRKRLRSTNSFRTTSTVTSRLTRNDSSPAQARLRPVVVRSVEEFLACGRLEGGCARLRCPKCRAEHLLALSCRQRGICSSCQAKRAALFAEKLTGQVLAPVPHRHWTFSIPRALRGLFERERRLLSLLSQTAYASILKSFQALFGRKDVRPGCVVALQTFGAYGCNFNPHAHAIVSDGVFTPEGEFLPLPSLDTAVILEVFRRLLRRRLHQAERLSVAFMGRLLSWMHPGFSVFAGPPVEPKPIESLESQARYIARPAMAIWTRCRNVRTGPWDSKPRPTRAQAQPCSSSTHWSGFIGSRRLCSEFDYVLGLKGKR